MEFLLDPIKINLYKRKRCSISKRKVNSLFDKTLPRGQRGGQRVRWAASLAIVPRLPQSKGLSLRSNPRERQASELSPAGEGSESHRAHTHQFRTSIKPETGRGGDKTTHWLGSSLFPAQQREKQSYLLLHSNPRA